MAKSKNRKKKEKKQTQKKKSFECYVWDLMEYLQTKLIFSEWTMGLNIEDKDSEEVSKKHGNKIKTAAIIKIDDVYLNFQITVYPILKNYYKDKQLDLVVSTIIHEFCHLYTEPLYLETINAQTNNTIDNLESVRERQTERIAKVLYSLLSKNSEFKKKFLIK